jgi:glutaredoxin-like protein
MEKMINKDIQKQLEEAFADLKKPVVILFFGSKMRACEYCEHTLSLLNEVAEISDKVSVQVYDIDENPEASKKFDVERVPGIVIAAQDGDEIINYGVHYSGIPAGHEFSSLIQSILMVSRGDSGLNQQTRDYLKTLTQPVELQVFVTPSCPYCPQAVGLAQQMAMESPFVKGEMVEAMEFFELSNTFGVSGVPHTIINQGQGEIVGAVPETALLNEIKRAVKTEQPA